MSVGICLSVVVPSPSCPSSLYPQVNALPSEVIADEQHGNIEEWTKMLDWRTDGIQTDKPEELIRFLKERD